MNLHPEQLLRVLFIETFHYRKTVVTIFIVVYIAMLALGLTWPKVYTASTSIVVEEKRVVQPLMQGAAVATDVADRARLAREVIYGRKIMDQILEYAGWAKSSLTPTEHDNIIRKLTKRTKVTNNGRDIIRIEYSDDEPERALKITQKLADLFISETLSSKSAESQSAYDFINKQTEAYHEKLTKAEQQLKDFRTANLDARPGSDADISARLTQLQTRIQQATQDLKEAEVRKVSLEKQLSGEAEVASTLSREGQFRSRIAELQSKLETLRLSYHDTYPDVVQIKHQIEDLNQAIVEDQQARAAAKASGRVVLNEGVINNPLYQQLKQELSQTKLNIEMLDARITEAKRSLAQELELGKRVHGGEAELSELTRDYQVNRDIYQDLLKRRENARVSMNLDMDTQGLALRIQEPPQLPLHPSGLRFLHFIIAGLVLGIALPLGMLFIRIYLDPRIRSGMLISEKRKLPLLAVIPQMWAPSEMQTLSREVEWLSIAVGGVALVVVATGTLRYTGVF
ncbi:MAG TPA: XrtA system polysaccharide chain length determinant [Anaerolineales bacterium]|nr:XrtA system polysaccharide chain length determinant [Anaerolineales bacterium]